MTDKLGDVIKGYENAWRKYLPANSYVIIRVDGKSFSSYTKGCKKPFDEEIAYAMRDTALGLCEQIDGVVAGYTQSDEISILVTDKLSDRSEPWFGNNLQKLVSVTASLATSLFNQAVMRFRWTQQPHLAFEDVLKFACFDARAFTLPSVKDVNDYFVWRQNDCVRNSISIIASTLYSHEELLGKNNSDRLDMISEKGDPWESYDDSYRYGLFLYKKRHEGEVRFIKESGDETESLSFTRSKWLSSPAHNFHKSPEVLDKILKPIDS